MKSPLVKTVVGLAILGGTVGVGLGVGGAISSAATSSPSSTTIPRSSPSTTAPGTNHHCPNMNGASTSSVAGY
jgi:hypothetical protein